MKKNTFAIKLGNKSKQRLPKSLVASLCIKKASKIISKKIKFKGRQKQKQRLKKDFQYFLNQSSKNSGFYFVLSSGTLNLCCVF